MCGIAGVIGAGPAEAGTALVRRMIDTIRHRGPDDEGFFAADNVAFGMRRLSIIDLAGGHQPIATERGTVIVFNGEIYNHNDLRAGLEARGHRFRTRSDTEVIVRLYDERGLDGLQRLDGMFAICLYDPVARQLHLVRDRLGKKPLYYGRQGNLFCFGSELKALLAALPERPALNRQAVHDYLTLRYVPGPDSVWQGLRKLEPGCVLTLDLDGSGRTAERRYWSIGFASAEPDPARDYVAEFEKLFLDAVEKRLLAADVPVGVLLSGGLDSSAVAAAAVELGHKAFQTFSVAFADDKESDERGYARQVAGRFGLPHREIVIDHRQFVDFLPRLVTFADEPLADLASVPLAFVCGLAVRHVKVVLSGEGSDEILAGYDLENLARRLDQLRRLAPLAPRSLLDLLLRIGAAGPDSVIAGLARGGVGGLLRHRATHITRLWTEAEKARLWGDGPARRSTIDLIRGWYGEAESPRPLDQLQQVYCRSWLVEDLLAKADRMSMAHSLELRCPFLDHRLVEWAACLPLDWKVGGPRSGYVSKRILRRFAEKRLPVAIVSRPKQGFPTPASRWLQGPLKDWAAERLRHGRLNSLFDVRQAEAQLAAAVAGDGAAASKIWVLLILDQWLEAWCGA